MPVLVRLPSHLVARHVDGVLALPVALVDVEAREALEAHVVPRAEARERVERVGDRVRVAAWRERYETMVRVW
jgi:hypothetical protein